LGHLRIDVIFTDPSAYTKPLNLVVNMALAADTEMLETVCETSSDHWGVPSEPTAVVSVVPDILAKYVGTYSGFWGGRPRTVKVSLSAGELLATIDDEPQPIPLVALSETLFESSEGLEYRFASDGSGPAKSVEEIHVSGDYKLERRR
jgi:hypothetical protein